MALDQEKFSRREFLFRKIPAVVVSSIPAVAAAVTLTSCDRYLFYPKSRVNEALDVFNSSEIPKEVWKNKQPILFDIFPCTVDIPPDWKITSLKVGEGLLTTLDKVVILRSPENDNIDNNIEVRFPISSIDGQGYHMSPEKAINYKMEELKRENSTGDVVVSDVKISGLQAKMLSYTSPYDGIQRHFIYVSRGTKDWDSWRIGISGSRDWVVKEMPKFKRVVDSFRFLNFA